MEFRGDYRTVTMIGTVTSLTTAKGIEREEIVEAGRARSSRSPDCRT
ncbi:MAG: hypothetical protein U0869_07330 [Chloroflexota bacterium]